MHRRFYTIFILPHAQARFRKLHLSRNFILTAAAILALALLGGAVAPHLFLKVQAQGAVLADLAAENEKLRQDRARFEGSLEVMGDKLDSIESRAARLAEAVGLDRLPGARPPAGGALNLDPESDARILGGELTALSTRIDSLELSFRSLDQAWEERARLLANTPSVMPVEGFFSDGFGWRKDPITGSRAFHEGIDIVALTGTLVRAPADGVVTRAGRMSGYGKMVHLSHGFGFATRYGHLSELLVASGTRVKRGQVIGRVGSTGRSTGPHLHYEVFSEGKLVNPRRFMETARH